MKLTSIRFPVFFDQTSCAPWAQSGKKTINVVKTFEFCVRNYHYRCYIHQNIMIGKSYYLYLFVNNDLHMHLSARLITAWYPRNQPIIITITIDRGCEQLGTSMDRDETRDRDPISPFDHAKFPALTEWWTSLTTWDNARYVHYLTRWQCIRRLVINRKCQVSDRILSR